MSLVGKACRFYRFLVSLSERFLSPLLDLAIRLWMGKIFFVSGWGKFANYLNGDWGSTVFLFKEVHPLPGVAPEVAAVLGTGGEVVLPVLLALGLAGRVAAAGLLVMTMVIQFVVPSDYGLMNDMHYLWMLLLAVPLIKGPGTLSLDHLLMKLVFKKRA